MSLDLASVSDVLRQHVTDHATFQAILKDLIATEKQAAAAGAADKTPRAKTDFVVLIRGDTTLQRAVEGGAWIIKQPEGSDTTTLLDRINRAAGTHNDRLKGKQRANRLIRTFARALELIRPKSVTACDAKFKVVTKTPVEVVVVTSDAIDLTTVQRNA